MIRINLLPYRAARTKENVRRQVSVFLLGLVLLLIILVAGHGWLSARTERMADKLEGLQTEVARYEEAAKKVEQYKADLQKLQQQIDVVGQLESRRENPPVLLAKVADLAVADRMQYRRLRADDNTVSIDGIAMDNETIADFMTRLERSGLFTEVILNSSRHVTELGVAVKAFQLVCRRKPLTPNN
jgi:type IV pilus assembly protein PilN